jgi:Reverse transcriptase (RNA-dependent DNA polymerase)
LFDANVFEFQSMDKLPPRARLLNAIWSYRRKRRPDGVLLKHKSRICVDGSQQQYGVDYWETYAPVVHWSTVRMVLVLSALLKLKSRQVDYTQAFPQAPLNDDVFMRIPKGWFLDSTTQQLHQHPDDPTFKDREHFIRLKRNLYGVKQAARNWFLHLQKGLLSRGFVQSKIDPCLFIRQDCILVLYTDDCLLFAKDDDSISDLCQSLSTEFLLKDEGDIAGFLGIQIDHTIAPDGSMCAWFVNQPNRTHQDAVKYLCRYLHYTRTQGLILTPTADNRLNAYVDSNFAGQWSHATCQLRHSAVSRTGYVILYCGCPIHWFSKLQSKIALSTTEAEYIALSMCLRDLLPMRTLLTELSKGFDFGISADAVVGPQSFVDTHMHQSTIFEDNTGCLELANKPDQYRPRTKHIGIKWHHFQDTVKNGSVIVQKINTTMQLADPLTKPLPQPRFETLCKLLMGW